MEGVESSEEAETEDDLETEELVEEAERAENIEKETENVDYQIIDNFTETVEEETVEEAIEEETVAEENIKKETGTETTRTGRVVRRPVRLVGNYTVALTAMEYGKLLEKIAVQEYAEGEVCAVGAGSTTGFENTNELKVLKYEAAMNGPNRVKWEKPVTEEYQRFEANKCFEVVDRKDVGSLKRS